MKKTLLIFISLILVFSLTGCGLVPSVELTESEQKVIAEYAAGLLLKHDKNYAGSIREIEKEEESPLDVVEEPQNSEPSPDENSGTEPSDNSNADPEFSEDIMASPEIEAGETETYSDMSVAEAIGTDGFDIIYKSYEVVQIYPPEQSEELVFSLEAAPGMDLLVLHFGITNDTADRMLCDVLNSETSFRIIINGGERVQAQKTMLLDDLGSYYEEIEGYGMTDAVLVFEVSEGTASTIDSLDLVIKRDEVSTTHRLR